MAVLPRQYLESSNPMAQAHREEGKVVTGLARARERRARENWETASRSYGRTKETDGIRETAMEKRNGRVMARARRQRRRWWSRAAFKSFMELRISPSAQSLSPFRSHVTAPFAYSPADSPECIQFLESGWMITREALIIDPGSVSKLSRRRR